jgi:hypothetical protein
VPSRVFYSFQNLAWLPHVDSLVLSRSDINRESLDSWAKYFKTAIRLLKLVMLGHERRCLLRDRLAGRIKNRAEVVDLYMIRSIWLPHTIDFSMQEFQSFARLHDENRTWWNSDYGPIPHNGGMCIGEPYLAQLGQH